MALESLIYGFIAGVVILLIAWRMGARPRAWREAIATTILYVALWLALKAAGFGGTETVTVEPASSSEGVHWIWPVYASIVIPSGTTPVN